MATRYEETTYGFNWGPLEVNRLMSDPKGGFVMEVRTPYQVLEIRASPSGKVISTAVKPLRKLKV